ncbi:MAG TPA: aminotransferase class IV [Planctomycetota bacterium]|nr:aminotransferase class IV [Planctomycetota bacterium]
MSDLIWLNGEYVKRNEAKISLYESGLLYGYGVFETIMINKRRAFQLTAHYDRLKNSAKHIRMPVHISQKSLDKVISRLAQINSIEKGYLRMVISSSEEPMKSMRFSSSVEEPKKNLDETGSYQTSMMLVETGPISPDYEKFRQSGVSVALYPARRSADTAYYRHKTLAYMENLITRRWAFKHKALEAIFTNTNDNIMEGTRSSFFIVKDHKVFTPSIESNILPGVTRGVVMNLCTKNAIKVREGLMTREDILAADEAFLTSTLMEIMPVTNCKIENKNGEMDTKVIKKGEVGPVTRVLQTAYRDLLDMS